MEYHLRKEADSDEYDVVYYLKYHDMDTDTITLINLAREDKFLSKMEYHSILHSREKYGAARKKRMAKAVLESSRSHLFDK